MINLSLYVIISYVICFVLIIFGGIATFSLQKGPINDLWLARSVSLVTIASTILYVLASREKEYLIEVVANISNMIDKLSPTIFNELRDYDYAKNRKAGEALDVVNKTLTFAKEKINEINKRKTYNIDIVAIIPSVVGALVWGFGDLISYLK